MARKYWEEMGYSTEWYYDRMRIRRVRLDDTELTRIIQKHRELATAELSMLAGSGNFNCYLDALDHIKTLTEYRAPAMQGDFFS